MPVKGAQVAVYTRPRAADALQEIVAKATLYEGVRLTQVLEAVYLQGKKDGAKEVFDRIEDVRRAIPHNRPGRPLSKRR
ncbi:MAG: hypothetical protein ACRDM7_17490 [Thermoleophilaceae bacterium]